MCIIKDEQSQKLFGCKNTFFLTKYEPMRVLFLTKQNFDFHNSKFNSLSWTAAHFSLFGGKYMD